MPNFNDIIKQISLEAVGSTSPSGIYFGTVTSLSPLKISIEQKMTLEAEDVVLSTLVQDFSINDFVVHLGLSAGEKVMLLRVQGGQKFIVLDRVR